jgi:hypothetical protein
MLKLAQVQHDAGHEIRWIGLHWFSGEQVFKGPFEEICFVGYDGERFGQPGRTIKEWASKTDLFHVHTHIRDMTLETVQKAHVPYIWDVHDEPCVWPETSPAHRLAATPYLAGKEGIAYRSYCPSSWHATPKPAESHLVLTSGLSDTPGHFRWWFDQLAKMRTMGLEVRVWSNSKVQKYAEVCELQPHQFIPELIESMSTARAGICGSPHPDRNMTDAMPNKLFEYVAAGIPSVCYGREHKMAEVIESNGLGVVIDSTSELEEALNECDNLRDYVIATRRELTMETQLEKIMAAYNKALSGGL